MTTDPNGGTPIGAARPFIGPGSIVRTLGNVAYADLPRAMPFGPGGGRQPDRGAYGITDPFTL